MERKLASIQRVLSVEPIEGADRIERVQVLGWQLVAKKGEFRSGDLCVYCEIDSVMPERPEFEFLRERKFRIRTMKMRGQISQGLAMPLSILPGWYTDRGIDVGREVTEVLGVTKYEPPIPTNLTGVIRRPFPTHVVPKTDEMRLQSFPGVLDEIRGQPGYITVKMDGTSATYYLVHDKTVEGGEDFGVCSRNYDLKPDETNVMWRLARKYDLRNRLLTFLGNSGRHLAVQGECCGPGINGNRAKLKDIDLFVFNIYDVDRQRYLDFAEFKIVSETLGLKTVPIDRMLASTATLDTVEDWLSLAEGTYPGTNEPREGIVVRPLTERYSNVLGGRLSFKVVNNRYLLAHGE